MLLKCCYRWELIKLTGNDDDDNDDYGDDDDDDDNDNNNDEIHSVIRETSYPV